MLRNAAETVELASSKIKIAEMMIEPSALRETAQGGLAATPAGREVKAKSFGIPLDKRE